MTCGRCYNTYQSKTHATSHSLPGIEHNTTMKDNTKGVKSMSPYGDISTITSVMGWRKVLEVPPLTTLSSTFLTSPSLEGKIFVTSAMGQWFLSTSGSRRSTMSPSWMLGRLFCHLGRLWSIGRYSCLHLSQKVLAKCWNFLQCWRCRSASMKHPGGEGELQTFWVRIIAGVGSDGALTSVEMVVRGLELIMADTSAMTVDRTLWDRWDGWIWDNMESRILLETPVIVSHTPPMWEEWGGLRIHVQPS